MKIYWSSSFLNSWSQRVPEQALNKDQQLKNQMAERPRNRFIHLVPEESAVWIIRGRFCKITETILGAD